MPFCARQTSHRTHEVSLEPSSIHKEALEHFLHMYKPRPTPPPLCAHCTLHYKQPRQYWLSPSLRNEEECYRQTPSWIASGASSQFDSDGALVEDVRTGTNIVINRMLTQQLKRAQLERLRWTEGLHKWLLSPRTINSALSTKVPWRSGGISPTFARCSRCSVCHFPCCHRRENDCSLRDTEHLNSHDHANIVFRRNTPKLPKLFCIPKLARNAAFRIA
jgi:hypothetical protein